MERDLIRANHRPGISLRLKFQVGGATVGILHPNRHRCRAKRQIRFAVRVQQGCRLVLTGPHLDVIGTAFQDVLEPGSRGGRSRAEGVSGVTKAGFITWAVAWHRDLHRFGVSV